MTRHARELALPNATSQAQRHQIARAAARVAGGVEGNLVEFPRRRIVQQIEAHMLAVAHPTIALVYVAQQVDDEVIIGLTCAETPWRTKHLAHFLGAVWKLGELLELSTEELLVVI